MQIIEITENNKYATKGALDGVPFADISKTKGNLAKVYINGTSANYIDVGVYEINDGSKYAVIGRVLYQFGSDGLIVLNEKKIISQYWAGRPDNLEELTLSDGVNIAVLQRVDQYGRPSNKRGNTLKVVKNTGVENLPKEWGGFFKIQP